MRKVTQNCAKADLRLLVLAGRAAYTAKCHEDRNSPALPSEAYDLATLIEQTEAAIRFQSFEIIRHERPAFRCYQIDERLTLDLVLIVAEKSLA